VAFARRVYQSGLAVSGADHVVTFGASRATLLEPGAADE